MASSAHNKKTKFETAILSRFLANRSLTYAPRAAADFDHDGWVLKGGEQIAELELTRYVVDAGRRGGSRQLLAVGIWDSHVWPIVNGRRRERPELRHVMASVEFLDKNPPHQRDFSALADQIVDVIATAWTERDNQAPLPCVQARPATIVNIQNRTRRTSNYKAFGTAYIDLNAGRFPLADAHVQQIQVAESSDEWPEWWGPDTRSGGAAYCTKSLQNLLDEKTAKLRKRGSSNLPVWLVIACDLFDDVRTFIYPRREHERQVVDSLFASCGYDFTKCPFDEIWLTSQAYGNSMRIEPPGA